MFPLVELYMYDNYYRVTLVIFFIQSKGKEPPVVYDMIGKHVCMGDHKVIDIFVFTCI